MPDLDVTIGGKVFTVSCQPGEEHFLRGAAQLLDAEAAPLMSAMGRLPEAKMLLMAGLMLADKTAALEDELRQTREKLAALEVRPAPAAERVEVPVIPVQVIETLAELAARAEAAADRAEELARA
ncbi:cell division protein ZapA [Neotabrizicola sp. sgz301269]|uniref:cell division protein ZapA n=1 Tax=Neotabrizicola sp. sgz301269 TaxID=3276282 RepID=UPI0037704131